MGEPCPARRVRRKRGAEPGRWRAPARFLARPPCGGAAGHCSRAALPRTLPGTVSVPALDALTARMHELKDLGGIWPALLGPGDVPALEGRSARAAQLATLQGLYHERLVAPEAGASGSSRPAAQTSTPDTRAMLRVFRPRARPRGERPRVARASPGRGPVHRARELAAGAFGAQVRPVRPGARAAPGAAPRAGRRRGATAESATTRCSTTTSRG